MQIDPLRVDIQQRRASGEKYESIARKLGISRAMVKYIETHPHYTPSKRIMAILFPEPTPKLLATRERRAALDQIARSKGFASWWFYEQNQIELFKKGNP